MKRILLVTAGLGSQEFYDASQRVKRQAGSLWKLADVLELTNDNLKEICPVTHANYGKFLNSNTVGFGFMSWKAEVMFRAMNLEYGSYETVVWADSGCEINSTLLSRIRFMLWILLTKIYGVLTFTLRTPENLYTKRDLFEILAANPNDASPQFQTTFFMFSGSKGRLFANRWFEIVSSDIHTVNEETSINGEMNGFRNHRHDQSVFSLVAKSMNIRPLIRALPNGRARGLRKLRALSYPIWAARNRTGTSIQ